MVTAMPSIVWLVVLMSTVLANPDWRTEMIESVTKNIAFCNWTELTPGHQHLTTKILDSEQSINIAKTGLSVVHIVPRGRDVEQFRKLPTTLTKAHSGLAAAAAKRCARSPR